MFAKLHLLSQDEPEGGGLRWRAHPYLRMVGAVAKGPTVFDWNKRQREDLEALWRDPDAEGARERLARDLAVFCDKLGWTPDANMLADAETHGDEYLVTLSAVPPELYLLPWEVIQVGAAGTYLSDYASAQVRYAVPGLEPREILAAPPRPGVLFAWSGGGGAVPHEEHAAAIRAAAEAGGVAFHELADVDERSLQAALDAGPPSVLHLLCHGAPGPDGEPPRLTWGVSDNPSLGTATRLARMLRRHSGTIRLVVLSACGSGDGRGDPLFMGSLAQELHKKGIPNVVASRYPLSVAGSCVLTRALYDRLLRDAWSIERALRHTREALLRVGNDGERYPGDAYGIQLYAYDTERFVSDNNVHAERPVLASYPFGTAARPVPAKGPPAAELTLSLEADPALSEDQLADKLRRVSEDESMTVATQPGAGNRAVSLIVRTTVDGAQRLLGAWRSKVMQTAVGVIVGELILTKGITPAAAGNLSAAAGKAAKSQQAASSNAATATVTGKAGLAVAAKAITAKIAVAAVIGSATVVGGGVAMHRATTQSSALAAPAALAAPVAKAQLDPVLPAQPQPASQVADVGAPVYHRSLGDLFDKADATTAEEAERRSQSYLSAHDCTGLKRYLASQSTGAAGTERVVALVSAAVARCTEKAQPAPVARRTPIGSGDHKSLGDPSDKADAANVEEARRRSQSYLSAHDCAGLKRYLAQQSTSATGTKRVVALISAAVARCTEKAQPDPIVRRTPIDAGSGSAITSGGSDGAPPAVAPVTTPKLSRCEAVNVEDAMAQASNQYVNGFASTALRLMINVLDCKQDIHMYRLAAIYACAAHDLATAKTYFIKLPSTPPAWQSGVEQKCQQEGLDVRGS